MKNKNIKNISILNLIASYTISALFIILMFLFVKTGSIEENPASITEQTPLRLESNRSTEMVYVDRFIHGDADILYKDHSRKIVAGKEIINKPLHNTTRTAVRSTSTHPDIVYSGDTDLKVINEKPKITIDSHTNEIGIHNRDSINHRDHRDDVVGNIGKPIDTDYDILERRLRDRSLQEKHIEKKGLNRHVKPESSKNVDGIDFSKMTLVRDEDSSELGDPEFNKNKQKSFFGQEGGELYAYNFPTQGVGAGVGSAGLGAGGGAGAGLGAGIGEGISNGEVVPTLGGVGTYMVLEDPGSTLGQGGGTGGLIGGAGAGGAAGLYTGRAKEPLGVGAGIGAGSGGGKGGYKYDHLPKDGALHIMMHVDGSGSILNTRKQLDIMKETILKDALLPYYNNDENLYNNRVTIVSSSGERTLKFFAEAAKKKNVLAIAFQDEAQPAYHLPNFNKKPEDHYVNDIGKLKSSLNGYSGVYRGVMFQVDRGKTFAKSFKEFVGNAFQGKGYLESNNLKKYHRDNNPNHIKNKDGIVFSDEYHTKDSGDPRYYLDLIFNASRKIGLDLEIRKAGLTDGEYIEN